MSVSDDMIKWMRYMSTQYERGVVDHTVPYKPEVCGDTLRSSPYLSLIPIQKDRGG